MVNGIKIIYPHGLNKWFSSKFCVSSGLQHETPEEGWRMHWPKRWEYNNKKEDDSFNILSDKNQFNCLQTSDRF